MLLIRKGNLKVYQAIFLSQLSNLASLTISCNDDLGFAFLGAMFRRSLCSDAPPAGLSNFNQFRKIDQCVDISPRDITMYMDFFDELAHALPLFYLSALQEFRAVIPEERSHFTWPTKPPRANALTRLCLRKSHAKEGTLASLLAATQILITWNTTLCVKWGWKVTRLGFLIVRL